MKRRKKSKREDIIAEWLQLYPIREFDSETDENGRMVVIVPRQENWLFRKILPKPNLPAGRVKLDEVGSFVWQCCDGEHTVANISKLLDEKFAERVKPADERTVVFLQQMYKEQFIKVYISRDNPPMVSE